MGMLTRMLVPRSVRRAVHPVRTVRRAVTPRPVRQVRRAMHPIDNAVYGMQRAITPSLRGRRRRRSRRRGSGGALGWLIGWILLLGCVVMAVFWPLFLVAYLQERAGNRQFADPKHPSIAAWAVEICYVALCAAIVLLVRRRIAAVAATRAAVPGWRQADGDPPGLQRWWDGQGWTGQTRWDLSVRAQRVASPGYCPVAPIEARTTVSGATYYGHGACTVRHRTHQAAARCRQG